MLPDGIRRYILLCALSDLCGDIKMLPDGIRRYDRIPTDFSAAVTMDPSATSESIFWISS
jgi:hypothetical protein